MGTIRIVKFVTLDGVIQSPLFPDEDRDGDFTAGGWVSERMDDEVAAVMAEETISAGALLLGSQTYDNFVMSWADAASSEPVDAMNRMPKYLVSRERTSGSWQYTIVLPDVAAVARTKNQTDGRIVVFGSGQLLPALFRERIVDEICLLVFPVVVGGGKQLFGEGTPPLGLRLLSSDSTSRGATVLRYVVDR